MAGEVSKQDQALTRAAGLVADARSELDAQTASLRGKLQGIGSSWKGGAATSFVQIMERWDTDTKKLISALDNFENNLRATEKSYDAVDSEQQSHFTRLSNRLG
jgi:WXG100 family type VII secretion target